eukprot:TRINITY_DN7278_c0_g1_i1.p1 TRINITY_DN7278_c0_g1~~TRINITY_DN7278_c0_g1_i1.p1  ORF type:complete len:122 (+),score=7.55 TRINITY_DN7278_c0_g1_i1:148-513(+)
MTQMIISDYLVYKPLIVQNNIHTYFVNVLSQCATQNYDKEVQLQCLNYFKTIVRFHPKQLLESITQNLFYALLTKADKKAWTVFYTILVQLKICPTTQTTMTSYINMQKQKNPNNVRLLGL